MAFDLAAIVVLLASGALAGTAMIQIQAEQPARRIPASLMGISFEETTLSPTHAAQFHRLRR